MSKTIAINKDAFKEFIASMEDMVKDAKSLLKESDEEPVADAAEITAEDLDDMSLDEMLALVKEQGIKLPKSVDDESKKEVRAYLKELIAEQEDEKPSKKKSKDDDDEEEEKPSKKKSKDDDDDEEEEKPSKKKSKDDDDEEEEEEKERTRKKLQSKKSKKDDDDEEEKPSKKKSKKDDDVDLGSMDLEELLEFAKDNKLKVPKDIRDSKKKVAKFIYDELSD